MMKYIFGNVQNGLVSFKKAILISHINTILEEPKSFSKLLKTAAEKWPNKSIR